MVYNVFVQHVFNSSVEVPRMTDHPQQSPTLDLHRDPLLAHAGFFSQFTCGTALRPIFGTTQSSYGPTLLVDSCSLPGPTDECTHFSLDPPLDPALDPALDPLLDPPSHPWTHPCTCPWTHPHIPPRSAPGSIRLFFSAQLAVDRSMEQLKHTWGRSGAVPRRHHRADQVWVRVTGFWCLLRVSNLALLLHVPLFSATHQTLSIDANTSPTPQCLIPRPVTPVHTLSPSNQHSCSLYFFLLVFQNCSSHPLLSCAFCTGHKLLPFHRRSSLQMSGLGTPPPRHNLHHRGVFVWDSHLEVVPDLGEPISLVLPQTDLGSGACPSNSSRNKKAHELLQQCLHFGGNISNTKLEPPEGLTPGPSLT